MRCPRSRRAVAACGGGDGGSESSGELKDVLNFENWPYYMDTKETRTAAGLTGPTTLEQFTIRRRGSRSTTTRASTRTTSTSRRSRASSPRAGNRPRHHRGDGQLPVPEPVRLEEYVQKLDKSLIPNIATSSTRRQSPGFDPDRNYSLPWLTGIDGIGWNEELTGGPVTSMTQLLRTRSSRARSRCSARWPTRSGSSCSTTATIRPDVSTSVRSGDQVRAGRARCGPDSEVHRQRLRAAAGEFSACVAWSGDLAQLVLENPNLKWAVPRRAGSSGPTTCSSRSEAASDRVDVHELRLRPEDLGAARLERLHLVGEGGQGRGARSTPKRARTSSCSRATRRLRTCTERPEHGLERRLHHDLAVGEGPVAARSTSSHRVAWARSSTSIPGSRRTSCCAGDGMARASSS